ncbi:endo alpha-1,4 polygalactosaminidase [Moritella sp.]|uniref:endo alpha-1,4 polygalactosaminidase n=1 Tax=Moritella sp. TaxID=78556 RepID=UPI0025ED18CF|nr:endo alpha-1,4 polygalactosaminidase [Moritella sp.]
MRLIRYIKPFIMWCFLSANSHANSLADVVTFSNAVEQPKSIAFYYNAIDSVRELMSYDRVVVNPRLISEKQLKTLHLVQTRVFAYISVGEFANAQLPASLRDAVMTENTTWQSYAMDLTDPIWQSHLLQQAQAYLDKGFDGLFLDTLDSYMLFAQGVAQQEQQDALINIVRRFQQLTPQSRLILNRGFAIVPQLEKPIEAVVAESLWQSYDPIKGIYHPVEESDSRWLQDQLDAVKAQGIEAIVIDYLPTRSRKAQIKLAKRLIRAGYTPYVSDGLLYEFGVSTIEPIPKRIFGLYNGKNGRKVDSYCHRLVSMPIEYQGYVLDCKDINTLDFSHVDTSKYAGAVIWLDQAVYNQYPKLSQWLMQELYRWPILFISSLPTDKALLAKLGIRLNGLLEGKIRITKGKKWLEDRYPLSFSEFDAHPRWQVESDGLKQYVTVADAHNNTSTLFFSADWGGAIMAPLPVSNLANHKEKWLLDPFKLLKLTLKLPVIPAPDVTTESGRRILTSHVDGDGFLSKGWFPGNPYTAEVLRDHVFKPYTFPQTVSVIEGEVGMRGLHPKQSPKLEAIARDIFKLPHIEIASHTFSHPFFWDNSHKEVTKKYGEHLPIPNYELDYEQEVLGSIRYIRETLAPKGKKVNVILWSGKADPDEATLAMADNAGLFNLNGGNTFAVAGDNDWSSVSPTIVWYPSSVQVYAPVLNENLYTNLWSENHDGYERTIETFDLLGHPRRLKSISIYYHMYSGAYPASLNSLIKVYDWALAQKVNPLYISEYSARARQLYETSLAKTLDGRWLVNSTGVRSIRLANQLGFPVINQSNIAGWANGPDGKYITLISPRTQLTLSDKNHQQVRLSSANGILTKWVENSDHINWAFHSYVPFQLEIANASHCTVQANQPLKLSRLADKTLVLKSSQSGQFSGSIYCK